MSSESQTAGSARPNAIPMRIFKRLTRISKKNRVLAAIVTATLLSTGTLMATAPKHDPSAAEEKAWPVSSVTASTRQLAPQLQLFGRVETPNHATLSSAIEAEVLNLHVVEGQQVRIGDLLVTLDARDEQLRLQQREADLREAEAQLRQVQRDSETDRQVLAHMRDLLALTRSKAERLKTLNSRQLIATEQLENTLQEVARQGIELARQEALVDNHENRLGEAQSVVSRARSLLETQQLNVARAEVRSPFDGRVSALAVSPGNRVRPGAELVTVYDTDALQIRVPVPSSVVSQLKEALHSGLVIEAQVDGRKASARLQQLAGEIGTGKSGIDALFTVADASDNLELGRAVDVQIELPAVAGVVSLPPQSIYDNRRVYVIEGERLRSIEVEAIGQRVDEHGQLEILVSSGAIAAGSQILATNLPRATSGLRVQVVDRQIAEVADTKEVTTVSSG